MVRALADLHRCGTVSGTGFGLGFEPTVQFATGMRNIRDVISSPRSTKNIECKEEANTAREKRRNIIDGQGKGFCHY